MTYFSKNSIRTCVVDDEPLAIETIVDLLEKDDDINVVGTAEDGRKAVTLIRSLIPDLVFLDIEMPGVDGFQALKQLSAQESPAVVFVTAHDKYALEAFRAHAYDYILKPFDDDEFRETVQRVKSRILTTMIREQSEGLRHMVERLSSISENSSSIDTTGADGQIQSITVRVGDRSEVIPVSEIKWISSAEHYCELRINSGVRLIRKPLAELERLLPSAVFYRIHRSTIINIRFVKSYSPISHGDFQVIMSDNARLRLSRSRSVGFKKALGAQPAA